VTERFKARRVAAAGLLEAVPITPVPGESFIQRRLFTVAAIAATREAQLMELWQIQETSSTATGTVPGVAEVTPMALLKQRRANKDRQVGAMRA